MSESISLQDAIDHLYRVAVSGEGRTSTLRLQGLARHCVQRLAERGLPDAETEATIPGGGRPKQWDVAWSLHEKYRLAISLKSLLKNLAGTVPNRLDDLMGEVANVQMYSPEIVVGYIMVFDVSQDVPSRRHGSTWCELLRRRLDSLAGRSAPGWSVGMFEGVTVVEVDFSQGPRLLTPPSQVEQMLDVLVAEVRRRNPSLIAPLDAIPAEDAG